MLEVWLYYVKRITTNIAPIDGDFNIKSTETPDRVLKPKV